MELPPAGPYIFGSPPPPAPQPLPFIPLPEDTSSSDEDNRSKLRRVTKVNGGFVRIPTPFVSESTRIHNRYKAFTEKYPSLLEQLVALRITENEHEIREKIIFDLTESNHFEFALYFYLEMKPCEAKTKYLALYLDSFIKADIERIKNCLEFVQTHQPHVYDFFKIQLAFAFAKGKQLSRALEIYENTNKKTELLYLISRKIVYPSLLQNPLQTIQEVKQSFPQPILEELLFVLGLILLKLKQANLIELFIGDMTTKREALTTTITRMHP